MQHPTQTIRSASQQIAAGTTTATELLDVCLAKIEQHEHELHAWVCIDERAAREQAKKLDEMFASGTSFGLLHGIPIGIKDIVDVAGLPTKCGSQLREYHVATEDAEVVRRLREAGAIIVGKTVTTEFACFDPPPTRNPWNIAHTPGGSSSGSAVAVATGMCLGAIGSQTGGSITRPASYCGVAGFKPTFGVVDRRGVFPVSDRLDTVGPICRTADDLSLMFAALTSEEESHAACGRLLLLRDFFEENSSDDVRAVTNHAVDQLRGYAQIDDAAPLPASFHDVHAHHYRIMAVEAAAVHREQYVAKPHAFSPNISSLIDTGLATTDDEYTASKHHHDTFRTDIDAYLDPNTILVMPATPTVAPRDLTTTGNPLFNSPWSYSGLPAANICIGVNDDGMPCGLQFVGARGADQLVLATAAWAEQQLQSCGVDGAVR